MSTRMGNELQIFAVAPGLADVPADFTRFGNHCEIDVSAQRRSLRPAGMIDRKLDGGANKTRIPLRVSANLTDLPAEAALRWCSSCFSCKEFTDEFVASPATPMCPGAVSEISGRTGPV